MKYYFKFECKNCKLSISAYVFEDELLSIYNDNFEYLENIEFKEYVKNNIVMECAECKTLIKGCLIDELDDKGENIK
jgi:hypothetical protein